MTDRQNNDKLLNTFTLNSTTLSNELTSARGLNPMNQGNKFSLNTLPINSQAIYDSPPRSPMRSPKKDFKDIKNFEDYKSNLGKETIYGRTNYTHASLHASAHASQFPSKSQLSLNNDRSSFRSNNHEVNNKMEILEFKLGFNLLNHKIQKLNNLIRVIHSREDRPLLERPVFKEFHSSSNAAFNPRLNTYDTGSTYFKTNETDRGGKDRDKLNNSRKVYSTIPTEENKDKESHQDKDKENRERRYIKDTKGNNKPKQNKYYDNSNESQSQSPSQSPDNTDNIIVEHLKKENLPGFTIKQKGKAGTNSPNNKPHGGNSPNSKLKPSEKISDKSFNPHEKLSDKTTNSMNSFNNKFNNHNKISNKGNFAKIKNKSKTKNSNSNSEDNSSDMNNQLDFKTYENSVERKHKKDKNNKTNPTDVIISPETRLKNDKNDSESRLSLKSANYSPVIKPKVDSTPEQKINPALKKQMELTKKYHDFQKELNDARNSNSASKKLLEDLINNDYKNVIKRISSNKSITDFSESMQAERENQHKSKIEKMMYQAKIIPEDLGEEGAFNSSRQDIPDNKFSNNDLFDIDNKDDIDHHKNNNNDNQRNKSKSCSKKDSKKDSKEGSKKGSNKGTTPVNKKLDFSKLTGKSQVSPVKKTSADIKKTMRGSFTNPILVQNDKVEVKMIRKIDELIATNSPREGVKDDSKILSDRNTYKLNSNSSLFNPVSKGLIENNFNNNNESNQVEQSPNLWDKMKKYASSLSPARSLKAINSPNIKRKLLPGSPNVNKKRHPKDLNHKGSKSSAGSSGLHKYNTVVPQKSKFGTNKTIENEQDNEEDNEDEDNKNSDSDTDNIIDQSHNTKNNKNNNNSSKNSKSNNNNAKQSSPKNKSSPKKQDNPQDKEHKFERINSNVILGEAPNSPNKNNFYDPITNNNFNDNYSNNNQANNPEGKYRKKSSNILNKLEDNVGKRSPSHEKRSPSHENKQYSQNIDHNNKNNQFVDEGNFPFNITEDQKRVSISSPTREKLKFLGLISDPETENNATSNKTKTIEKLKFLEQEDGDGEDKGEEEEVEDNVIEEPYQSSPKLKKLIENVKKKSSQKGNKSNNKNQKSNVNQLLEEGEEDNNDNYDQNEIYDNNAEEEQYKSSPKLKKLIETVKKNSIKNTNNNIVSSPKNKNSSKQPNNNETEKSLSPKSKILSPKSNKLSNNNVPSPKNNNISSPKNNNVSSPKNNNITSPQNIKLENSPKNKKISSLDANNNMNKIDIFNNEEQNVDDNINTNHLHRHNNVLSQDNTKNRRISLDGKNYVEVNSDNNNQLGKQNSPKANRLGTPEQNNINNIKSPCRSPSNHNKSPSPNKNLLSSPNNKINSNTNINGMIPVETVLDRPPNVNNNLTVDNNGMLAFEGNQNNMNNTSPKKYNSDPNNINNNGLLTEQNSPVTSFSDYLFEKKKIDELNEAVFLSVKNFAEVEKIAPSKKKLDELYETVLKSAQLFTENQTLSPQPNKLDTLNEAILRSIKKITDKKENESIVGSPAKSIKSNNTDFDRKKLDELNDNVVKAVQKFTQHIENNRKIKHNYGRSSLGSFNGVLNNDNNDNNANNPSNSNKFDTRENYENNLSNQNKESKEINQNKVANETKIPNETKPSKVSFNIPNTNSNSNIPNYTSKANLNNNIKPAVVEKTKRVTFTDKKTIINYEDNKIITVVTMNDEEGNPIKKPALSFKQNQKQKFNVKGILKIVPLPEDEEKEKKIALDKLNDLINEFDNDSDEDKPKMTGTPQMSSSNPKTIAETMLKNIRYIQEVEELKKSGKQITKKRRFVTPGKKKAICLCNKFREHPEKFFTEIPVQHYFDTLNIKTNLAQSCGKYKFNKSNNILEKVKNPPKYSKLTPLTKEFNYESKRTHDVKTLNSLSAEPKYSNNEFKLDGNDNDKNKKDDKNNINLVTPVKKESLVNKDFNINLKSVIDKVDVKEKTNIKESDRKETPKEKLKPKKNDLFSNIKKMFDDSSDDKAEEERQEEPYVEENVENHDDSESKKRLESEMNHISAIEDENNGDEKEKSVESLREISHQLINNNKSF